MAQVFPRILASFAHKSLQANQVVLDPYTEYLTHGAPDEVGERLALVLHPLRAF